MLSMKLVVLLFVVLCSLLSEIFIVYQKKKSVRCSRIQGNKVNKQVILL